MSELKPCPFCGSAGREVIRFYEDGAATSIRCQTCKVVTAPFLHIPEAVSAWNTRHGEDKLQERIDDLEWMFECDNFNIGRCKNADAARECIATRESARASVEKK